MDVKVAVRVLDHPETFLYITSLLKSLFPSGRPRSHRCEM